MQGNMIQQEISTTEAFLSMNLKIVIVDDSILVRERLIKLFSTVPNIKIAGVAGNSYEAIHVVEKEKPHAVILDIKMPGESGVEVLKELKKKFPEIVVIILTNYPFTQYRSKCYEYGADYFFDKSEEYNKVVDVLENMSGSVQKNITNN